MIYNETFWIIIAILFWSLLALMVVTLIVDTFVRMMYYKWDRDERHERMMQEKVEELVDTKK